MNEKPCAEILSDRIEEVVGNLLPGKDWVWPETTYIQDPIWGEIKLDGHEAALLNTPLMQRLRRIKQLGTVHLVFPGATHTRFEHSLGVLAQASRMCDGLNEGNKEELVCPAQKLNLRFAALCHDLGHGPFSHCSELFYPYLKTYRECGGPKSAEKLSALIVKSDSFHVFCERVCKKYKKKVDLNFVAKAITGGLPEHEKYLGEIIHGPFDADKIDYLMRDGQYCGMPVKVDAQHIHRSMTRKKNKGCQRLVGKPRAAPALIQLVHLRQHMFAVAYWHRTARVSKGMLLNALRWLQKRADDSNLKLNDVFDLFSLDDERLLSLGSDIDDEDNLFQRLRDRKLFQIAMKVSADDPKREVLGLIEQSDDKEQEDKERLAAKAQELAEEIAKKAELDPRFVVLDPAWPIGSKETNEMLIIQGQELKALGEIMKIKEEGFELQKFLNHHLLCCPQEHVGKVKEAAQSLGLREAKN